MINLLNNKIFSSRNVCAWIFVVIGFLSSTNCSAQEFDSWLEELKKEARIGGISDKTLDIAFKNVSPVEKVIALDRNQPEFTMAFSTYVSRLVSQARIDKGKKMLSRYRTVLAEVSKNYNVQPRFLVALWGIETDFGRIFGGFPVVDSLVTLAFDERRSLYFRKELIHALHILDKGMIPHGTMLGSWAGAMGGLQFMPSVFRAYGVDSDSDGRVDLWQNPKDLFSSGANYLSSSGWKNDQTWGREVVLPEGFDLTLAGHRTLKGLGSWQKLGVRRLDGSDLPSRNLESSLIIPEKNGQRVFLVYNNYRVLLKWNRSDYFATAVGLLSDRLRDK